MCFSHEMSAGIAIFAFGLAAFEHRSLKCPQYTIGILYYACMELLQAIQYSFVAEPDDGYSMCQSKTNQVLTVLGGFHICFQPLFTNILFSSFFRTKNIRDRIESDILRRLSVFAGIWFVISYLMAILYPEDLIQATEDCPNYDWMREGYDGYLNATTPNLPGHSCTYRPPTESGHLAWVVPLYRQTYFMPGTSVHFFLFFAPYIMSRRFCLQRMGLMMLFAGPYLVAHITASVNEQPAIWCFLSCLEIAFLSIRARMCGYITEPIPPKLIHEGGLGEQRLEYAYVDPASGGEQPKEASTNIQEAERSTASGWLSWYLGFPLHIRKMKQI